MLSEVDVEPPRVDPSNQQRRRWRDRLTNVEQAPRIAARWVQRPAGSWRPIALDLGLITLVTAVGLTVVFRLWEAHLRVPFGYGGDGLVYARDAKVIVQTGWIQTTPRLGAPFGQELYDFPISGDNGHYVIMRLMALFTSDWAVVLNGFLLLSFFTAGWSAYLVMRWLRCGRISSVVCALLFAFAPYHFGRGAGHLMLASYFVVPISILVAVRAASGRNLIVRKATGTSFAWPRARGTAGALLLCIACGSFGSYYTFFAIISIIFACSFVAVAYRNTRPLLTGASHVLAISAMFAFNIAPNLLYRWRHGANPVVGVRQAVELDLYGLRVIQLITPVPGDWFPPLRALSDALREGYMSEASQYFGTVAAAAFLTMLGWLSCRALRGRDTDARPSSSDSLRALLAVLSLLWILTATTGGLDWVVWVTGFKQLRAWNRVSILLMFVVLCWLALTLGPWTRRWVGRSTARRRIATSVAGVVLLFGLVEQGSASFVPPVNAYANSYASDRTFFTGVEEELPPGAMVYVLPYRRFPEELPTELSADYDLYRPFLQTKALRFSYGGMKGREADWEAQLADLSATELVRDVLAVGFQAIIIDRAGYADFGSQIESDIQAATGREPRQSGDGRWAFVDLTGLDQRFGSTDELAAIRASLLAGPRLSLDGCSGPEGSADGQFYWCSGSGTINVIHPAPGSGTIAFQATVVAPGGAGTLSLDLGDHTQTVSIGPSPEVVTFSLPDSTLATIDFTADVNPLVVPDDPRDLRFRLIHPVLQPAP